MFRLQPCLKFIRDRNNVTNAPLQLFRGCTQHGLGFSATGRQPWQRVVQSLGFFQDAFVVMVSGLLGAVVQRQGGGAANPFGVGQTHLKVHFHKQFVLDHDFGPGTAHQGHGVVDPDFDGCLAKFQSFELRFPQPLAQHFAFAVGQAPSRFSKGQHGHAGVRVDDEPHPFVVKGRDNFGFAVQIEIVGQSTAPWACHGDGHGARRVVDHALAVGVESRRRLAVAVDLGRWQRGHPCSY